MAACEAQAVRHEQFPCVFIRCLCLHQLSRAVAMGMVVRSPKTPVTVQALSWRRGLSALP